MVGAWVFPTDAGYWWKAVTPEQLPPAHEMEPPGNPGRFGSGRGDVLMSGLFRGVFLFSVLFGFAVFSGAAWGQECDDLEDEVYWETESECRSAEAVELYLEEFPKGCHVEAARACLTKLSSSLEVEKLLSACKLHFSAGRLTEGVGGSAVDCYEEVLSLDRANISALQGLELVFEEYLRRTRSALDRGDTEEARAHLPKLRKLAPEASEVAELENDLAALERPAEAERLEAAAEAERRQPGYEFQDCAACPEMVVIPGGSFLMGSPESEPGRYDDEGPQRRVNVQSFALGKYEVTFAEYDACVDAGGCRHRPNDVGWGRGRRPVINVSWDDAKDYVSWLSERAGPKYRLASEAEWEYAARAGTTTPYSFGENINREQANFGQNVGETVEVGSYPGNGFGLHDMHGNVWEWVEDCWHGNYDKAPADGSAWTSGDCSERVLRGGSWLNLPEYLRSAFRIRDHSGFRIYFSGFRVARTL